MFIPLSQQKSRRMKRLIFVLFTCIAVNINAQTFTEIYRNDKFKANEFTGDMPEISLINNEDDDTIWVSYFDQTLENSKIISLDKDLNIISSTMINYPPIVLKSFEYKINDKFYRISFLNQDTLKLRCFDRNGNNIIDKDLWVKNNGDSLWINRNSSVSISYRKLTNNKFLIVTQTKYPSSEGADALKFILIDTLGNILNSKIYSLKARGIPFRICEVGEHLLLEKVANLPEYLDGYFNYDGISYINKETLEIEDSIPRGPFFDTISTGIVISNLPISIIAINDTTFAGLIELIGKVKINIYNKNTKEIISTIIPPYNITNEVDIQNNEDFSKDRFVFNNTDSIYTHYVDNGLTLLNFSSIGNINFQYKLTFPSDYIKDNYVRGMKITDDGEVIMATTGYIFSPYNVTAWLIKFNPKGLIGLTNIETGEKEQIKVYPNPARDYVYVDIEATNFSKAEIELFDMQGKLVKKAKLSAKHGNRVDVSNLNAGAYTYNVSLNGKTISGKVIVGK